MTEIREKKNEKKNRSVARNDVISLSAASGAN